MKRRSSSVGRLCFLFPWALRQVRTVRSRGSQVSRLGVESLEPRCLLDGGPFGGVWDASGPADRLHAAPQEAAASEIQIELRLVTSRSAEDHRSNESFASYSSVTEVPLNGTYHAEVWLRDTGTIRGIAGGTVDLAYTTAGADATLIDHGSVFNVLTSGAIDDASGLVDNLGGGTFSSGEGTAQWVRLATTTFQATAAGDVTFALGHDLASGSANSAFAEVAAGSMNWDLVAFNGTPITLQTTAFPFTIDQGQFVRDGQPVFLNIINYQPIEPGKVPGDAISEARIAEDLEHLAEYQGGRDPVLLRVNPQPTEARPVAMPQSFYDGLRTLDFWAIRDIYCGDFNDPEAAETRINAVIQEVKQTGGADRIFAWQIAEEYVSDASNRPELTSFLSQMRDYIKQRVQQELPPGTSDWVTWGSWPPADLLGTDGFSINVQFDFYSVNAYSYDPERIRDHELGPVTGTSYAGYLAFSNEQLTKQYPGTPLVISETGLSDGPQTADDIQDRLHPWYALYRKGGLNSLQVGEGLVDRYMDARLSGAVSGITIFEWSDEWWKTGDPGLQGRSEEYFGLHRWEAVGNGAYELREKPQEAAVRRLFTLDFRPDSPVLTDLIAESTLLMPGDQTTLEATVDPQAPGPILFRWESSTGRVVGDSATVRFVVGDVALGRALVTVLAVDAAGHASTRSLVLDVVTAEHPNPLELHADLEVLTRGAVPPNPDNIPQVRASGWVTNVSGVDLTDYAVVIYAVDSEGYQYLQPQGSGEETPFVPIRPDGYWWGNRVRAGTLKVYLAPRDTSPPLELASWQTPAGMIASAAFVDVNDADNDLLPDDWETFYALVNPPENPARLRYEDPDGDELDNLEEFLAGKNPTVSDNDVDADRLPDNWEYEFFRTLAFSAAQDLDRDGSTNGVEFSQGTHPGRPALGLPLPTVDWGDAPTPYPTTLADGGAVHQAGGPTLGVNRDSEADGQPNATATGDDTAGAIDDEDGVTFGAVRVGQTGATLTVIVQNAPGGARLDAWIDFNADGSWGGPLEQIASSVAVEDGDNTVTFDVPNSAVAGTTLARFRLSTAGGLGVTGAAADGEVEDYELQVQAADRPGDDIIGRNQYGYLWVATSNGTNGFRSRIWGQWSTARTWSNVMTGDFNGDGYEDFVGRNEFGYWWVAVSNGSDSFSSSIWGKWEPSRTWTDVMVGDFNADGRDDLVGRNQFGYWWVAASNGSGGFTNSIWGKWDPARTWTNVMVGDFNKDGCSDLVARNEFGYWWVAASNGSGAFVSSIWGKWDPARTWTNVMVGDFNADGADDLIGRNQFGYWWVAESNGSNALANAIWGQWSTARTWTDVMVGDFDGSGADDLVGRNEFGYWWVAKSNGTDALANGIWGQWDNSRNWTDVMVGDFNRDGDDDLVGRDKFDYWWVGESDGWDQFATAYWGKWNDVDWLDVLGGNFGD